MYMIDVIPPIKEVRVKNKWFDSEVVESIKEQDKLFKKPKLQIDKELFNAARNMTQNVIWMIILACQRNCENY